MKRYLANRTADVTEMEREGAAVSLELLREGVVLLENRDYLPMTPGKRLALYGYGARNTVYGGLGAASIHIRKGVSVEEGLEREGFTVTTKAYLDRYQALMQAEEAAYYRGIRERCGDKIIDGVLIMYSEPYVPSTQLAITEEDILESGTDTAVYVISRCSGEGADRRPVPGDYELSEDELANLERLEAGYVNLIVIMNTCGVIDTKRIRGLRNLKALLFVGLGAAATGTVVAEVLSGKVCPSGKLTSTWAENYLDYPSADTYAAVNGNLDDEEYREGIYVGYRWFDAFQIKSAYCFGYGLSYTEFDMKPMGFERQDEEMRVSIEVCNRGNAFAGKTVAQLYVAQPAGRARKAVKVLAGYAKTELLAPGAKETVIITVPLRNLASYDSSRSAWVLEPGDYLFCVGGDAEHITPVGVVRLDALAVTEQCTAVCVDEWKLEEFAPKAITSENPGDGRDLPVLCVAADEIETYTHDYADGPATTFPTSRETGTITFRDVLSGRHTAEALACDLSLSELAHLLVGNVPEKAGEVTRASVFAAGTSVSLADTGDAVEYVVPGTTETTVSLLQSRGIPKLNIADGGSGLRLAPEFQTDAKGNLATSPLFSIGNVDKFAGDILRRESGGEHFWQYPTAFPMAMVMAQTWNRALLRRCGEVIGREADAFGTDVWMAPSMNIHRSPLCGRNYEYYSEDPFITGSCAIAALEGFQQCRYSAPCVKHFACNNQEDNRGATNAHVSEQALREIYMRGFEMAVRARKPRCLMTSLNLVNGVHMANQRDLLTTVLRQEWGFDGLVMCDWGTTVSDPRENLKYGCSSIPGCIRAGNDLIMPGTQNDIDGLVGAVERGKLTMEELYLSATRMLKLMASQYREE